MKAKTLFGPDLAFDFQILVDTAPPIVNSLNVEASVKITNPNPEKTHQVLVGNFTADVQGKIIILSNTSC